MFGAGGRSIPTKVADRLAWWVLGGKGRFDTWQRRGYHVQRINFYESIPDTRALPASLWHGRRELPGIDLAVEEQLSLLESFRSYGDEFRRFPEEPDPSGPGYHSANTTFLPGDAEVLYCMVRRARPRRVIEVGSGMSTHVFDLALAANRAEHADAAHYTVVDPRPAAHIASVASLSDLRVQKVQEVELEAFEALEAGDILFIDSTHVVATGSDVVYLLLEALPRLRPGVLVHLHDIFLPYEYPRSWLVDEHFFWTEQYLLAALLTGDSRWRVRWASQYLYRNHRDALIDVIATVARLDPDPNAKGGPASFWVERA